MRLSIALLGFVAACTSVGTRNEPEFNVMNSPPVCDSVPPPVKPGEQLGATMPADVRAARDSAVVVGTLTEVITGRTLGGAGVALLRDTSVASSPTAAVVRVPTDASGGFVLTAMPGTYTLDVRRIGGVPLQQSLTLRAGVVDTLRLEMSYLHCVGY